MANTMTEKEAYEVLAAHLAKGPKRRIKFYRQFYSTVKCITVSPKTFAGVVRVNDKGTLQLWEGKSAGGWIDVIGRYRVIAA